MVREMSFASEKKDERSLPFLKDNFNRENIVVSSIVTKKIGGNIIHIFSVKNSSSGKNGLYQISATIAENWKINQMKETLRKYDEPVEVYFYRGEGGRCIFGRPEH